MGSEGENYQVGNDRVIKEYGRKQYQQAKRKQTNVVEQFTIVYSPSGQQPRNPKRFVNGSWIDFNDRI